MPTGCAAIETYVDQAAQVLNLPLQPEHRPEVIVNFDRITTIAQLVLDFPLPTTAAIAPVFQP